MRTVASMLKMLQRLIGEDIELIWKPAVGLWPVKVDPSQIDQILANLSINARDAITSVGKLIIETENAVFDETYSITHPNIMTGEYVLLSISDTGCGMDKETLDQIFEPFFTTKELGKGTGLGLATVYGIVKQNNGFINVYSESGQGTIFKIYLPRVSTEAGSKSKEVERKPDRGTETVLLVEDDVSILNMVQTMLERYGYSVLSTSLSVEALSLAEQYEGPIHLLVTDVVMPGMNGKDLRDKLEVLRPGIKTLFMSGYTVDVIAPRGVIEEGIQLLQKPFSDNTLAQRVREILDS